MLEDDMSFNSSERNDYNRDRRGDRRDRGGRRRDRKPREKFRKERERLDSEGPLESNDSGSGSTMKIPIILAKKTQSQGFVDAQKKDTPTILGIQRRTNTDTSSSPQTPGSSGKTGDGYTAYQRYSSKYENKTVETASPATTMSQSSSHSHVEHYTPTGLAALKIGSESYLTESVSVIDGSFQWSDKAIETLLDQTDYVVVGCVGMQACGKSTLMSLIAGQKIEAIEKTRLIFRPQKKFDMEKCIHRTVGVDIYVTRERMIVLDTQPLLSPSMLEQYLKYDRKVPSEYSTAEICLEVQALQLITFLYTVCHAVVVVQDHILDMNLLNLLKTSEMLKPSTISHNSGDGSNSNTDDLNNEFYPHLVFVYTFCDSRCYEYDVIRAMCEVIWKMFENSRLHVRGGPSMLRAPLLSVYNSPLICGYNDINVYFLPAINTPDDDDVIVPGIQYKGHPSLPTLIKTLRQQLSALPRLPFTHHMLSEKNWFHYAARTWEAVKKSNLVAEYHRLLTT